ncbi:2-oxoglutarate dehydrogenase, E2 component, dihydrolipoamide succinyltransferase [Janibacter cremeus]|uniref:2-oxoglutarate dehydrogenase, E2 component, dihydrolipoamide succinyltransferase n=1 Tax=Janibacter cremeus TaxID=1285192 RepID=UPI0023F9142B|nr:2-oxoglutarate dehydrogenase, E2 component, dihydrolipoamide succinyltransferase [Janibacter cremeus]WEV78894.1 2-oxoglutarate dehydrogenase, E2 component, dihydrolipoamide succinyltransferase [Janibacter cremeus]
MSERVTMPALGESVTEGTVTRWLKNVGDTVEVDEPLLEVSTDKVDTEIPSPVAGTIQEILAEEDDTVEVGADLAVIGDGEAPASSGDDSTDESEDEEPESEEAPAEETSEAESSDDTEEEPAQAESSDTSSEDAEESESAPAAEKSSGDDGDGTTVSMPALGESVTEGTISRWLKSEGDEVEVDEPLLEVSTDKVDTEIPSPVAGTLTKILVEEDQTVEVGADLAIVGGSGGGSKEEPKAEEPKEEPKPEPKAEEPKKESKPEPKAEEPKKESKPEPKAEEPKKESKPEPKAEEPKKESKPEPKAEEPKKESKPEPKAEEPKKESASSSGPSDAAAYVTPLVRKLAADNDIDLAQVEGTGIGGRIRKQDVLDAAKAKNQPQEAAPAQQEAPAASAPAAAADGGAVPAGLESNVPQSKRGTREPMSRLRKVIAKRMVESLQVSAQLTTVVEVDMTKVSRVRDAAKAEFQRREGTKLSFLPFIALATAEALKAHPGVNASVEGEEIVYHKDENLSIAVDTEGGLITPVVKNAGDLNLAGLARAIADVADRTRNKKITPDDLAGGTFTITNTGSRGALFDTPILNQPQVGMLGTGSIVRRPVVVNSEDGGETIAIRSMMYLAMSYDHRVVDGADAARFLGTVKARLEEGNFEA